MSDDPESARWARDCWRAIAALVDDRTGLPCDGIDESLTPASRSAYTSPTNVAGYLWSVVAARDLGLLTPTQAGRRCRATLRSLAGLRRHDASGMYLNWYHPGTGDPLTAWPGDSRALVPFVSSVDNAWLSIALTVVAEALPELAELASAVANSMDFGVFYDPAARPHGGLMNGGFWLGRPRVRSIPGARLPGMAEAFYTRHHYDLLVSETRIVAYVAIARGQVPRDLYAVLDAPTRSYRGRVVTVSFGGAMFETLAPTLFIPEMQWSEGFWAANHRSTVASHREFALDERRYPVWGFSPCLAPDGTYREFGVKRISWLGRGYPSERAREAVVTPHAAGLALLVDPDSARTNLSRIANDLQAYGAGGFADSVGARTRRTPGRLLAVDQALLFGSLAHVLADAPLQRWFTSPATTAALRPLVAARRAGAPLPAPAAKHGPVRTRRDRESSGEVLA